ncbi:hypothetical protein BDN71DRAFT_1591686 [Pleurotus eryngii]|uniref:Mug135-like C-terminal domain-containing protein n=1 Tax=Pleurotus eryngii TaxID=5323 RepID=A0A9P5ZR28_PLEER|nr:hypothetical protein BDN71DRAFT_1591686 [Pleurotus eryngii]
MIRIAPSQTILGRFMTGARLYAIIAPSSFRKGNQCIEDVGSSVLRQNLIEIKDSIVDLKQDLKQEMWGVKQEMQGVAQELRDLRQESVDLRRLISKFINGTRAEGSTLPYEEVPFTDGAMPSKSLRRLTTLQTITALSSAHADSYLDGHGIEQANHSATLAGKQQQVAKQIGVASDVLRHRFGNYDV